MNKQRIEIAAKAAVYRDINQRLFDDGLINQALFEFGEAEIQRFERMSIRGNESEEIKLAPNVTVIEPLQAEDK